MLVWEIYQEIVGCVYRGSYYTAPPLWSGVGKWGTSSLICGNKCIFNKHTMKVCDSVLTSVPQLILNCRSYFSGVPEARNSLHLRELCHLKKPLGGARPRLESCWEERKRKVCPWWIVDLPGGQINIFFTHLASYYLIAWGLPDWYWSCNSLMPCISIRKGLLASTPQM